MGKIKDLTGEKFNKLTVISFNKRQKNHTYWNCLCECGNTTVVGSRHLHNGHTKSCGCVRKNEMGVAAFKSMMRSYKVSAKKRNIEFLLSESEFEEIINMDCFYCGKNPTFYFSEKMMRRNFFNGNIEANGIDRIDNEIGYIKSNCVACCKECNFAKADRDVDDFVSWIDRVYRFQHK